MSMYNIACVRAKALRNGKHQAVQNWGVLMHSTAPTAIDNTCRAGALIMEADPVQVSCAAKGPTAVDFTHKSKALIRPSKTVQHKCIARQSLTNR